MKRFLKSSLTMLVAFLGITSASEVVSFAADTGASKQRFLDNGDGTIIDQTSDLVWQAVDDSQSRSWSDAVAYCRNLTLNNKSDWRLPTKEEMTSIVDQERSPAIDTNYFKIHGMRYWTLSAYDNNPDLKCFAFFTTGEFACTEKKNAFLVRCVRNDQGNEQVIDKESSYTQWTTSSRLTSITHEMNDNRMFPGIVEGREVMGRYNGKVLQYRAKFIPYLPDMDDFHSRWGMTENWYKDFSGQYKEQGFTEYSHTTFVDEYGATLHQATWVLIFKPSKPKPKQKQSESNGQTTI